MNEGRATVAGESDNEWSLHYHAETGESGGKGSTKIVFNHFRVTETINYKIELFFDGASTPSAHFTVEWTFFSEAPLGFPLKWYSDKSALASQQPGAFTRRRITDFQALKSLHLPWTIGLRSSCREENQNIVTNHLNSQKSSARPRG
jgi:hypothetical protein